MHIGHHYDELKQKRPAHRAKNVAGCPPVIGVPPMTVAAMASNSMSTPTPGRVRA